MTAEGKQNPAVVEIDARAVGLVSPLPQQVRARWDSWQADGLSGAVRREVSLDEIQSRLQAAEAKRAVRLSPSLINGLKKGLCPYHRV